MASAEDVFVTLERYDSSVNDRLKLILKKMGYDKLITIAAISKNPSKLDEIQASFRKLYGKQERCVKMTNKEKIELFGELFYEDPESFEFLHGDRDAIICASEQAEKLLKKYEEEYSYEKPGDKRKRRSNHQKGACISLIINILLINKNGSSLVL